jgi:hypothetical protein
MCPRYAKGGIRKNFFARGASEIVRPSSKRGATPAIVHSQSRVHWSYHAPKNQRNSRTVHSDMIRAVAFFNRKSKLRIWNPKTLAKKFCTADKQHLQKLEKCKELSGLLTDQTAARHTCDKNCLVTTGNLEKCKPHSKTW